MAEETSPFYEARYGWDRKTQAVVAGSAVFTVFLALADTPLAIRVLGLVLFGCGGLFTAYVAMSRKVAFRVDETGVLLGGSAARYRATTAHVPWQDITAVVLWQHHTAASMPWVGLARRPGAAPLPGPGQGRVAHATVQALVPGIPADVTLASRAVNGWRLDKARLSAAVAHFAPQVPVVDAG